MKKILFLAALLIGLMACASDQEQSQGDALVASPSETEIVEDSLALPLVEKEASSQKYECKVCNYVYDDAVHEVNFEDLDEDWDCPICGRSKRVFKPIR